MAEPASRPLDPAQRIQALDVIRGVALLGILVVNMQFFNSPMIYLDILGISWFESAADRVAEFFIRFLAEGKFISIFSFLFGVGLFLQWRRLEEKGAPFVSIYSRRLLVLLAFGIAHGLFIWSGDILAPYAVMGFILLLVRRAASRKLLIGAGVLLGLPVLLSLVTGLLSWLALSAGGADVAGAGQLELFQNLLERSAQVYATGSFAEVTVQRAIDLAFAWGFGFMWLPLPLAMFILGFYAARVGIIDDLPGHRPLLQKLTRWGLPLGLAANLVYGLAITWGMEAMLANPLLASLAGALHTLGAPLLALGYMAVLTLLLQDSARMQALASRFSAVGRMALTNYLMQSVLATFLFYGYGLGWYGQVGPALGLALTAAIFGLQLLYSPWWMQRFKYGPAEWLWRSLTYGRRPALLRPARDGVAG